MCVFFNVFILYHILKTSFLSEVISSHQSIFFHTRSTMDQVFCIQQKLMEQWRNVSLKSSQSERNSTFCAEKIKARSDRTSFFVLFVFITMTLNRSE